MTHDITRTVIFDDRTEALQARRFLLTIDEPSRATAHRIFGSRVVTIGTGPDNDVVLEDPSVSRKHCEVRVEAAGYRLVDLDSKNGTRLGDLRIRDAFLRSGASIVVGATTIRFETTDEEVELLLSGRTRFGSLVGGSAAMRETFAVLERVAPRDVRVLLVGPPGSGKQQAAEAIHAHSGRRGAELVVLDCSAVSAANAELELFGDDTQAGALEQANGGTLYLVEPQELSPDLQARLSRTLDRAELRRAGRTIQLDARIITGSEAQLRQEAHRGAFRSDLYYQLAVVEVRIPPLRERPEDIPLIVEFFLEQARRSTGVASLNVTYATMEKLRRHSWPGNVAELRNFVERAVALSSPESAAADVRFVEAPVRAETTGDPADAVAALMRATGVDTAVPFKDAKARLVEVFELEYWAQLLRQTGGNVSAAARIAGVHRKSLEYILRKLDIGRGSDG
ncbi:MAG: sigma 54-interacting transcriptional regulator [Myxococcales bacterium]|nr:sigma 54-interacting transcriptional regulator [Myxococcales bacterium]MCB9532006.1 sigma 54-interacting transcriptional regulator [Myxococcales bacterium]MCB9533848.1 sigma 54-interacting transcriptional regulator [Myxococcales bacterium]